MKQNCYKVLGVRANANLERIEAAYIKVMLEHQAQREAGAADMDRAIFAARECHAILTDPSWVWPYCT